PAAEIALLDASTPVLRRRVVSGQAVGASDGGRYLVLSPWGDRSLAGTYYRPLSAFGVDAGPAPEAELREALNRAFPWLQLAEADVCLVHRGRVPGRSATALWDRPLLR